jgi:hypothetical protein
MTGTAARVFERVVIAAIAVNAVVVVAALAVGGHEEVFEAVHNVILAFFAVELAVHLRAHGWRFLRRPVNAVDAALIVASALPALGADAGLLRLARLARLAHLGRHISGLRVLRLAVGGGRLVPVAAAVTAALLVVPVAHADPDSNDAVCVGFDLGMTPAEIAEGLQRNGAARNYWDAQRDTASPIIGGQCDN